ncbi:MAG: cysteine--tRNA ligase [Candidatus Micrarchaeia archaeon]
MLKVYNSLTKKIEEFAPGNPPKVSMYVCGVTVYDFCHLGHARTYAAFDTIRRHLQKSGYEVEFVQNVTDVDDKIIKRAKEKGVDPLGLAAEFDRNSREDFARLGIENAGVYPKVTENIKEIIEFIGKIVESGNAYANDTGVYFEIGKFRDYGKLSGQDLELIKRGARIEVDESKKDPADFALWKKTGEGELGWDSPWGRGRPGWHIECSTMSKKHIHGTIDIHGGARDLIFPHHENEIAQSESYDGQKFVKYWLHTGFLTVNGEKMAKSLGNFVTIRDALAKFNQNAGLIRWFFAQTHYRSPIDYSEEEVKKSEVALKRTLDSIEEMDYFVNQKQGKEKVRDEETRKRAEALKAEIKEKMDNDFDTPGAIATFNDLLRLANQKTHDDKFADVDLINELRGYCRDFLLLFGIKEMQEIVRTKQATISSNAYVKASKESSSSYGAYLVGAEMFRTKTGKRVTISKKLDVPALLGFAKEIGAQSSDMEDGKQVIETILEARDIARGKKDYALADRIRKFLNENGIEVED